MDKSSVEVDESCVDIDKSWVDVDASRVSVAILRFDPVAPWVDLRSAVTTSALTETMSQFKGYSGNKGSCKYSSSSS